MPHIPYAPVRTDFLRIKASELPALNAADSRLGYDAWQASSVELKAVKWVFEDWKQAVWSAEVPRIINVLSQNERVMRRLVTHPDELVMRSVIEFFNGNRLSKILMDATPSPDIDRLTSFMAAFLGRLDPLLAPGAPAWSPLLDQVGIEHSGWYQLSPLTAFRADAVNLPARVTAAFAYLGPDVSPLSLVHEFESVTWRKSVVLHSPAMPTELMAYALAQKFVTNADLIPHRGLSETSVRFLVLRAILDLSRGHTAEFSSFIAAFYQQGYSLSFDELTHLKLEYLSANRQQGYADAISGVRELVADPELSRPLLNAISPAGFASLLQPLSGEMWGVAMLAEYSKSLIGSHGTAHLQAALQSATPAQVRTAPRSLLRHLLSSTDKDLRVLATKIVAAWDAASSTEVAAGQNFLEGQGVALPSLRRAPRRR